MAEWTIFEDDISFKDLVDSFGAFCDSHIHEIVVRASTFIEEDGQICFSPVGRSASMIILFESEAPGVGAIEIKCEGVDCFTSFFAGKGVYSYIDVARFSTEEDLGTLSLYTISGPVRAEPNTFVRIGLGRPDGGPDFEIRAESFSWRKVDWGFASPSRYWRNLD